MPHQKLSIRKLFASDRGLFANGRNRLFELLKGPRDADEPTVMFFSDGGADIREVQLYLNPEAEHYLDWFHIDDATHRDGSICQGAGYHAGKA